MQYTDKLIVKEVALALIKVVPFVVLTVCVYLFKKAKLTAFSNAAKLAVENGYNIDM